MRKPTFNALVVLTIIVLLALPISSHHYRFRQAFPYAYDQPYYTTHSSPHFSYHYNTFSNAGAYVVSLRGHDPHHFGSYGYYPHYDDYREYVGKKEAVDYIDRTFNGRYDRSFGKSSADAFSSGDNQLHLSENRASNWRNKNAYDLRIEGTGTYQDHYYQPRWDSGGFFNWEY